MDKKYIIGFIVAICVILGGMIYINHQSQDSTGGVDLNPFVKCLNEAKVIFYGAFWCPHCQATKKMFGAAKVNLPYVECSTPDGNGQTQICIDKGIKQYPTWVFSDGSQLTGEQTLQSLSDKSSCPLPSGLSSSPEPQTTGTSSAATTVVQ